MRDLSKKLSFKPKELKSPVLERLIEEVRNEEHQKKPHSYNRFHTRHNKSR